MNKLITKHEMFCQEYMSNGFNATKAYQAVYKVEYKQAESNASRLMGNDKIKGRLDELKKEHQLHNELQSILELETIEIPEEKPKEKKPAPKRKRITKKKIQKK